METLTHWKKNNDPKYISGEDLKDGLSIGKGLRPEMPVIIVGFEDKETFDQNNNSKVIKTGLFLQELNGTRLYKPMILNNTNAAFWIKETGSQFMEHWIGKPAVLMAIPDKRHGHVARFKKYVAPVQVDPASVVAKISGSKDANELKSNWEKLTVSEKNIPQVLAEKERLKESFAK